ncbi:iron-containing alcohol dehydrogenase [Subtercola frigoramans]|uniref:Alcohol dehydrogenase class IV n=1 Tax=Subtercola frigoramans TaxID=120298 RepID=A0ABS2L1G6_9MICO|nr:iron-containing alcohol dehydrogenase [Subtercola frigoramans]MBM7470869.1 alcohol dehydrogenase class IV [Subtercola frigoramans]
MPEFTGDALSIHSFGVLRLPDRIHFGEGSFASVPREAVRLGRRVLVVCDPFLLETEELSGLLESLASEGAIVSVESEIIPELPLDVVERVSGRCRSAQPDVIIGFGGGSALDMAKLVSLTLRHGAPLTQYYGENAVPGPVVPLIAIPTTAGTGSEVTGVAVLTDPDRDLKVGISSPYLIPRIAVVDPLLSVGAPARVTAASGADAFVHAVEAFTAAVRDPIWGAEQPVFVGRNDLSSLLALTAVRIIFDALPRAVRDGGDLAARHAMAYGSLLAGMAFGSAGTHLSHAIQYPVGALTHTPHGVGTGMLLPFVLREIRASASDRLAEIAEAIGVATGNAETSADAAIVAIASMMREIGLPASLAEMGVTEADVAKIVDLTLSVKRLVANSTLVPDYESIARIVTAAYLGNLASELPELHTAG